MVTVDILVATISTSTIKAELKNIQVTLRPLVIPKSLT